MTDFGFRIKLRTSNSLNYEQQGFRISLASRDVTVESGRSGTTLFNSDWLVVRSAGFATQSEASFFGEQFGLVLRLAALSSKLGLDLGEDQIAFLTPESGSNDYPSLHGLSVYCQEINTRFVTTEVSNIRIIDPLEPFLESLSHLSGQIPLSVVEADPGVRVMNAALLSREPLAKIVLSFSAVETLGQTETWTTDQTSLIEKLAILAERSDDSIDELGPREVADALRRSLHRVSLRQGAFRVLSKLGLDHLRRHWDELYGLRSALFHGTRALSRDEIGKLANDSVSLCGHIVLKLVEQDGVTMPPSAKERFDPSRA